MCRAVVFSWTLLASTACASIPIPLRGDTIWIERKTVARKERPPRLVARDGSICHTSPERYRGVHIGDQIWCHWTGI